MPVKGLTDRKSIEARYPILGKLRKGDKKRKNRPGEDLAYFRFTGEGPRFEEIERIFYQRFGPKPDRIRVILPYETVEESFPTWREKWRGTRARILDHRCDGEKTVLLRRKDGSYSKAAEDCPGGCSLVGRLNVVIPELLQAGLVGTVTIETHGKWDCVNITNVLARAEKQAARYGGTLEGMDCIVYRSHEQVKTPEGLPVTKWLVRIALTSEWAQSLLGAAKNQTLQLMGVSAMPKSDEADPIEAEVVDAPPAEAEVVSKAEASPPAKANGRPLSPADLRRLLHKKAVIYNAGPASEGQVPSVARKFAEAFAPADDATDRYHLSLSWLWSTDMETIDSATKLTFGQASATLAWLLAKGGADDSGDTPLHEHAPAEAAGVYRVALKEQGQMEMSMEAANTEAANQELANRVLSNMEATE